MKKLGVLFVALWLTACATIQNPLTNVRLVQLESAYGVALSVAVGYYELYKVNRCTKTRPESVTNYCARRSVVVALQKADIKAGEAIQTARKFVIQYPTFDATNIISAAEFALAGMQDVITKNGVRQ